MSIVDRLIPGRGDSVHVDLSCVPLILIAVGTDDLSPEPACSTELSQLHEVVGPYAEDELDTARQFFDGVACFRELVDELSTPRECIAQLLVDVGTGVIDVEGIDREDAVLRQGADSIEELCAHSHPLGVRNTLDELLLEGIEVDRALALCYIGSYFGEISGQFACELSCYRDAAREVQLDSLGHNALEQDGQCFLVDLIATKLEAQRGNPLVEDIQCLFIGFLGVIYIDVLTDEPLIVHTRGADIGVLCRHHFGGRETFEVFATIEGVDVESFVGTPDELTLEVSSLQVGHDLVLPFLCANGREFAQ